MLIAWKCGCVRRAAEFTFCNALKSWQMLIKKIRLPKSKLCNLFLWLIWTIILHFIERTGHLSLKSNGQQLKQMVPTLFFYVYFAAINTLSRLVYRLSVWPPFHWTRVKLSNSISISHTERMRLVTHADILWTVNWCVKVTNRRPTVEFHGHRVESTLNDSTIWLVILKRSQDILPVQL